MWGALSMAGSVEEACAMSTWARTYCNKTCACAAEAVDPALLTEADLNSSACAAPEAIVGERLYAGDEWFGYNLGDLVQDTGDDGIFTFRIMFRNTSLGAQHASQLRGPNDIGTFTRLVAAHAVPPAIEEWCAVHVRTGDVMDCDARSAEEMLNTPGLSRLRSENDTATMGVCPHPTLMEQVEYVRTKSYYTEALTEQNMSVAQCNGVLHMFAASQYELRSPELGAFPKSTKYLRGLRDHLCSLGYTVHVRLGRPPDEDFSILSKSRRFLSSGGGFSRMVGTMRDGLARYRADPTWVDNYTYEFSDPFQAAPDSSIAAPYPPPYPPSAAPTVSSGHSEMETGS